MDSNVLYRRTLRSAKAAQDGETPTLLQVVYTPQLMRSYALEFSSEDGVAILALGSNRDAMIDDAVLIDPQEAEKAAVEIGLRSQRALTRKRS